MAGQRQLTPQEMADLSTLFYKLAHNKETRPIVAKLVEKVEPARAASFSDVKQDEKLNTLRAQMQQYAAMQESKELKKAMDTERQALISSGRYNEDQTKQIEAIMTKHGLTDYKAGAALYAYQNPPPDALYDAPPDDKRPGATWEFPTINGRDGKPIPFADFAKNPTAAATNAAYTVISEFKKRNGMSASPR